jgi:LmbE family N-acetylglucosaminyl deacetylase
VVSRPLDIGRIADPVLVVAPHPDDESIGCGGLIAGLRARVADVFVVIMSDGSGSHPNSARYPAPRLARLREAEAVAALSILRVPAERIAFWRLADRSVPQDGAPDFPVAVDRARRVLRDLEPRTLVLPDRADGHGDHRATWAIWSRAALAEGSRARLLEYPVWPGEEARPAGALWTVDIAAQLPAKRRAIAAHRSQHGAVVTDDPAGFRLPADLLARAERPTETYFEAPP